MIEQAVFYDRLDNHCRLCEHWRGVCLKGHALATDKGCPLHKFPPVNGADYAVPYEVDAVTPQLRDCCGGKGGMPPMTWPQVLASFTDSMVRWLKAGVPLADRELHGQRYAQCKTCDEFRRFYCERCRCIAFLKTKLATEQCPKEPPRWVSAIAPGGQ